MGYTTSFHSFDSHNIEILDSLDDLVAWFGTAGEDVIIINVFPFNGKVVLIYDILKVVVNHFDDDVVVSLKDSSNESK